MRCTQCGSLDSGYSHECDPKDVKTYKKQTKVAPKKKKRVNGNRKGKSAERKLVPLFAKWWGSEFFRTPESGGMATRLTKMLKIDLSKFTGDVVTLDETFPFCIESKKVEGWTLEQMLTSDKTDIHKWWEQAVKQTPAGKKPLLVFTKNHAPLYGMMRWGDTSPEFCIRAKKYFSCDMPITTPDVCCDLHLGETVIIFPLSVLFESKKENWLYDR